MLSLSKHWVGFFNGLLGIMGLGSGCSLLRCCGWGAVGLNS